LKLIDSGGKNDILAFLNRAPVEFLYSRLMNKSRPEIESAFSTTDVSRQPASHQILTSARSGIFLDSWELTHHQLPLQTAATWHIKKFKLHGGKQEGVDVIEVNNGRLRFAVAPTRGMSVLEVETHEARLGWESPVKEVIHPQYVNLQNRGGLGWLEGFNEWLVRCGLEWAGHPGRDRFRNHLGDEVEMNLTLHGKIGNTPASEVEVLIEAGPPPRIHLRGLVEERMFHGPKLSILTDISTELGSNAVRLDDVVTNHGGYDQEFQILYHANFGAPLLGPGARFYGAIAQVKSFNAHAARDVKKYHEYAGPKPGFNEQVYCLQPLAGTDGRTEMMLQNSRGDRGVSLVFPVEQLPCVTLWKNLAAATEGYVTGIEPGTSYPYTRRLEREAGRVSKLAPNQMRRFTIDFAIHGDLQSVQSAVRRIQNIQAQTAMVVDGERVYSPVF